MFALVGLTATSGAAGTAARFRKTVTTSTGVVTHGSIRTTPYTRGWLLRCGYSHSAPDDPIRHPGHPGASHDHDFFGNTSTNARSTVADMLASPTTCGTAADTAAYWQPTLLHGANTVPPDPSGQQIYYRYRYPADTVVRPIPLDLRIVVGKSMATSTADNPALVDNRIYWECGMSGGTHYDAPPPTCGSTVVVENVVFPSCWDGNLTHADDTAHVAYAPDLGACPAGFPTALPRISLRLPYQVGRHATGLSLSSGPMYTAHADFWNTWQPAGIAYLTTRCLNAGVSCGTDPIAPMGS